MPGRIEGYEPALATVAYLPLWKLKLKQKLLRKDDPKPKK